MSPEFGNAFVCGRSNCSCRQYLFDIYVFSPPVCAQHTRINSHPCSSRSLQPLQPNASDKLPADSIGALGVTGEQGGGDNQSGKSSLVNTADLSEEDADERLNAGSGSGEQREVSGRGLAAANANGDVVGNGVNHDPVEAATALAGANGEKDSSPSEPARKTASEKDKSGRDHSAATGLTPPPNTEAERYPADLFDVLEAWILEYLRDKLHGGFLLSSHFQEYTRFLHVQQRPVTENDFILFRILGRGGFGAVNGTSPSPIISVNQMQKVCEASSNLSYPNDFAHLAGVFSARPCVFLQGVSAARQESCLQ